MSYDGSWQTKRENYRSASLTSVPGRITEQIRTTGVRPSLHRFTKGRACSTSLISLCDKGIHLVEEGKAVDTSVWTSVKLFPQPSPEETGLDGCTVPWVKSCLDGQTQRVSSLKYLCYAKAVDYTEITQ